LAVVALSEREDAPPGETSRASATTRWAASADDLSGGPEPEPIMQWLAVRRVERLLESFGMTRDRRRELIIQNCMTRAIGRWREARGTDLSALALEEVEDALGRWFSFVLEAEALGDQPPLLVGQAAFEICQAPTRWPGVLLSYDHLPPAFVEEMRAAKVVPTPAEVPGAMLEQCLDSWSLKELVLRMLGRWSRGLAGPAAPAT
jgi:hypothetical protein